MDQVAERTWSRSFEDGKVLKAGGVAQHESWNWLVLSTNWKGSGESPRRFFEAIEAAIVSAYKRNYGSAENVRVELDDRTGRIQVFA